jgi:phage tail sheath protein FI
MPQYFHPGVYIEEIERGPVPIEGVPTSLAAFLGETERGPSKPTLCTGYKDYQRYFGDVFDQTKFMPYAVSGFFTNGGAEVYVCRLVPADAKAAQVSAGTFTLQAVGAGTWGNRVYASIDPSTTKVSAGGGAAPVAVGFRLRLAYYSSPPAGDPNAWFADNTKGPKPNYFEDFNDLVTKESSPDFYAKRLVNSSTVSTSSLATLVPPPGAGPSDTPALGQYLLTGGTDGTLPLTSADYEGKPAGNRILPQGLEALLLDPYRDVALVYGPNVDVATAVSIIIHCENSRYRFAVIDCDKSVDAISYEPRDAIKDTEYAAYYYPWIYISDPLTGARKAVPPGGHILGIYSRSDAQRGVFKAPANEVVNGALDLYIDTNDASQDVLNPKGINAIRRFPGRGIRLWGARTLTSDALWKYVSVRRLFIFLEHSIFNGTQWVVFEPNDQRLWARVIDSIRLFLRTQWRAGALFGATEKEAFFITCDLTTMTQDDILNGRLICEIGIAPVRPAEFVIFRIFQNTAETTQ